MAPTTIAARRRGDGSCGGSPLLPDLKSRISPMARPPQTAHGSVRGSPPHVPEVTTSLEVGYHTAGVGQADQKCTACLTSSLPTDVECPGIPAVLADIRWDVTVVV